MIIKEVQLRQTKEAAASIQRQLDTLGRDREKYHPDRFALIAKPLVEELASLILSIKDYEESQ